MFVCKSKTLANFLMNEGLKCKKVDKDRLNPKFMVFLFERNESLSKAMDKWELTKNTYSIV